MRPIARRIVLLLLPAGARAPVAAGASLLCLLAFATSTASSLPIDAQPPSSASVSISPLSEPCDEDPWAAAGAAHPPPPHTPPLLHPRQQQQQQQQQEQQPNPFAWSDGMIAGVVVGLFVLVFVFICGGYLLRDRCRLWRQRQQRQKRLKRTKIKAKTKKRKRSKKHSRRQQQQQQQQQQQRQLHHHLHHHPEHPSQCSHWIDEKRWHANYTGFGDWWTPGASLTYVGKLEAGHMFPPFVLRPHYIDEEYKVDYDEEEEEDEEEEDDDDDDSQLEKSWFYTRGSSNTTASQIATGGVAVPTTAADATTNSLTLTPPPPAAIGGGPHDDSCCSPLYTTSQYAASDSSLASWLECPAIPQALQRQEGWHTSSFEELDDVDDDGDDHDHHHSHQSRPPPPVYFPSGRPSQAMCYHRDGHHHVVYSGDLSEGEIESADAGYSPGLFPA
ncbi:hypothetical protein DFQ27_009735 [Actinomortierella ambigua]|uniref:Uncharacterized protein n=1 Tax=Actinomortierella ambigua TaxID=1343610 RepID=A0A9P6QG48_9FUNG|nr:hypothetical protein DFQ27_009735 [Actinomortierella ambigua]